MAGAWPFNSQSTQFCESLTHKSSDMIVLCTLLLIFIVLFLLPFLTFMLIFKSIHFRRFNKQGTGNGPVYSTPAAN